MSFEFSGPQTIKIVTQNNPVTGAKQIIAIPIQSSAPSTQTFTVSPAATSNATIANKMVSPMKVIKIPASGLSGAGVMGDGIPPGVKVVKLSATTSGASNATKTVYSPQVKNLLSKMSTVHTVTNSRKKSTAFQAKRKIGGQKYKKLVHFAL